MDEPVKVVITLEGGIPQIVYSDVPVKYLVLDYDPSDCNEDLPIDSNGRECYVYQDKAEVEPEYVKKNFELLYNHHD